MYGADDFLPVLTYVIAQCDMLELDAEIEYMMELLDPSLLHGEGKYPWNPDDTFPQESWVLITSRNREPLKESQSLRAIANIFIR